MKYTDLLSRSDQDLARKLRDFVPDEIYDIHAHPHHPDHFAPGTCSFLDSKSPLGCAEHRTALQRYMPSKTIHGLYFGMPHKTADHLAINTWVASQVNQHGTALSRGLMLVTPNDDRETVAKALRSGHFCGIKVYHCYSGRANTMYSTVEEYAPDWMGEILHEIRGIMLLHIVREGAMEDTANQHSIRRLCRTYPKSQLILAHVGRSFNYRNARNGFHGLVDLDNVVVDITVGTIGISRPIWVRATRSTDIYCRALNLMECLVSSKALPFLFATTISNHLTPRSPNWETTARPL